MALGRAKVSPAASTVCPATSWDSSDHGSLGSNLLEGKASSHAVNKGNIFSDDLKQSGSFQRNSNTGMERVEKLATNVPKNISGEDAPKEFVCHQVESPLLLYILSLSQDREVNFSHLHQLVSNSRNDLCSYYENGDKIVHIIARKGLLDVLKYLHEEGLDCEAVNRHGYRALHLAACENHPELVECLVTEAKVDINAKTCGDLLTPVHCAARNNALNTLKALINLGAGYELEDYRGRTALHLAVEYDRSYAVRLLLELPQPASCGVKDHFGQLALVTMIKNMPKLAQVALSTPEVREIDSTKGKQSFHIARLEPCTCSSLWSPSVFSAAVHSNHHGVVQQAVIQKVLEVKWKLIRPVFAIHYISYIVFLLSWTVVLVHPATAEQHQYQFPRDLWRVAAWALALGLLGTQMGEEVWEAVQSKRNAAAFHTWQQQGLDQDQEFLKEPAVAHLQEYDQSRTSKATRCRRLSAYFIDFWNIIDISSFILLVTTFLLHLVDVGVNSTNDQVAVWQGRVSCLAVSLIWLKSLKFARAMTSLGPFIIIIGYAMMDVLRYAYVFATFIIPASVCFWIVFGGNASDAAFTSFPRLMFMLYRLSLVDDYPFQAMTDSNETMAFILVGIYLWVTAVIGLNLFIALLSYTFQKVYDNAQTHAQIQRASVILHYELLLFGPFKRRYWKYIRDRYSPLVCEYDDDEHLSVETDDNRVTDALEEVNNTLSQQMKLIGDLREEIKQLRQLPVSESRIGLDSLSEK